MKKERKKEDTSLEIEKGTTKFTQKKSDTIKKVSSRLQPHPEQLRVARILDNAKKEDTKLEEKIKHVVEATQKSADEAYVALHDTDFDPNKAVEVLLEGRVNVEWSTLSKKKRSKTSSNSTPTANSSNSHQRLDQSTRTSGSTHEYERESPVGSRPSFGNRGYRGRGRGTYQSGRYNSHEPSGKVKVFNNSSFDDDISEVIETQCFERARTPAIRPVDTWDPSRPVSHLLNKGSRTDLDEEEYTGSLAKGLIITSSCYGKNISPVENNTTSTRESVVNCHNPKNKLEVVETKADSPNKDSSKSSSASSLSTNGNSVAPSLPVSENTTKPTLGAKAPPITASVIKALPRIDKSAGSKKVPINSVAKPSPKVKNLMPVEMPPGDDDNNGQPLDVTFGTIELPDKEEILPTSNAPFAGLLPAEKTQKTETKPTAATVKTIQEDCLNLTKELKTDTIYESPLGHSSLYKTHQKTRNTQKSVSFPSEPVQTSNIYSSTIPSIYSSPVIPGPMSSACAPQLQFNALGPQVSQSTPICQNMSNTFPETVLGNQTYTSNSQYGGTSVLPSSFPYQSYSSMVQGQKQPPTSSHFTKEQEDISTTSLGSISYSGPALSVPIPNALTTTKNNNVTPSHGKNVSSNMHTLVSPQIILGQGGIPYFQPPLYYQDMHLMQQQRLTPGYYDVNYPPTRDCSPYHMNDKVFGTCSNDQSPLTYRDSISGHYTGISMTGNEGSTRMDNYKPIQIPMSQPLLSSVKHVTSASKINSYD